MRWKRKSCGIIPTLYQGFKPVTNVTIVTNVTAEKNPASQRDFRHYFNAPRSESIEPSRFSAGKPSS